MALAASLASSSRIAAAAAKVSTDAEPISSNMDPDEATRPDCPFGVA